MQNFKEKADKIWEVANLLRGDYKRSDYGKVILPMTVLRRLDSELEQSKQRVLDYLPKVNSLKESAKDIALNKIAGFNFHNKSSYNFDRLIADPNNVAVNLRNFINGFSTSAREIIEYFNFDDQIDRMDDPKADILFRVVKAFQEIDMKNMDSMEMGYVFEDLIRRFAEQSNETAGEHFTPREVIRLMVNVMFIEDKNTLTKEGIVKTLYDPACGTGGMLSVGEQYVKELNPKAELKVFGQEINPESYAICKSDMLIKGQNPSNIKFGNTFTVDGLEDEKFDYMLSNPPFGVDWKKAQKIIKAEHENKGMSGRFGAGLPRINDGSLLFLQHMISKMKAAGTRIGIVFNGSPLFSGAAESGESNIRKWIIENDWLEAIIGLPDQLFYNTGIKTYVWIITNNKNPIRKEKIQLINATGMQDEELVKEGKLSINRFWEKMDRSLGKKRKEIAENGNEKGIGFITQLYGNFEENEFCKIFPNDFFGYWRIPVETPLIQNGEIVRDSKNKPKPDKSQRDYESVPFLKINDRGSLVENDIDQYFTDEIAPYKPDSWFNKSSIKIGYDINLPKLFNITKGFGELKKLSDIFAEKHPPLEKKLKNLIEIIESPELYRNKTVIKNNWLTEVPDHWEFKKFKYGLEFNTGFTPPTKDRSYYNGDTTWVTIADMDKRVVSDSETKLTEKAIIDLKPNLTIKGSLLFSFKLSVGKVSFAGEDIYTNEAILSIPPSKDVDLRYFYYSLPEQLLNNANENIYGAKILNQETIKNAFLTFPPLYEQIKISDFLDEKLKVIEEVYELEDLIFGKVDRQSGLLHSFRTSFINSVITGKIKITD